MSDTISSDTMDDYSPLSQACIKALTDKMESKRKFAAGEIEKMTVEFSMYSNFAMVHRLVVLLGRKFCLHHNQNFRKGGLIGLAAVMVGFKNGTTSEPPPAMIEEAIRPLLTCLLDSDPRMRYHACESLFNVTKVAKGAILAQFQSIFDCLSKIVCDPSSDVRIGAEALDRLLKDIVVEQPELDMKDFIERMDEYVYTKNPFTRMFIISWIRLLDTKLNMVAYLPHLLDGIFNCLYDTTEEIRATTLVLLSEFLNKMVTLPADHSSLSSLMNTLLKHAKNEREDPVQFTAVSWLRQFIRLMDDQDLINFTPGILSAILPCLAVQASNDSNFLSPIERSLNISQRYVPQSNNQGNICEISTLVNSSLLEHVTTVIAERRNSSDSEPIINDLELILEVLTTELQKHEHPVIKLAIFDWLKALKKAEAGLIIASVWQHKLFQALLNTLSDKSDAVVKHSLRVIADVFCDEQENEQQSLLSNLEDNLNITKEDEHPVESDKKRSLLKSPQSTLQKSPNVKKVALSTGTEANIAPQSSQSPPNINRFVQALYKTFRDNERVFEGRATFIVFNLCSMIKACIVYRLFAEILKDERSDLKFAYNLVQKLNHILLTSQPLFSLRSRLANEDEPEMVTLFQTIYLAWCHSPMAAFTLCLAANNFRPANEIVCSLAQSDISAETIKQIESVVDLIESPAFSSLRIRLLDVSNNQFLIQSLYGLLMILPQSQAYNKLSHRLDQAHKFMCAQPHFRTGSPGHVGIGKQTSAATSAASSSGLSTSVRESSKKPAIGSLASLDAMVKHYNIIQGLHARVSRVAATAEPED